MHLESFIFDLVLNSEKNKRDDGYIERDINILNILFGFSDERYPNGQSIANKFSLSREFIRQRIEKKVTNAITEYDKNIFQRYINTVSDKSIYTFKSLKNELLSNGLNILEMNAFGFHNFIHYLDIDFPYDIYNFEIIKANRKDFSSLEDFLLIKKDKIKPIRKIFKNIFISPGLSGLVDLSEIKHDSIPIELIRYIITNYRGSWIYYDNGKHWFTFENRDNVIINKLGKIKSLIDNCESQKLSEIIHSSITTRTIKYTYPNPSIIKAYLEDSIYTDYIDDKIYFKDNLEIPALSESDNIIINYFNQNKITEASYSELKETYIKHNFTEANAVKNCYHSPFLFVDKSSGRKNYKLNYITQYTDFRIAIIKDKYVEYREKLIKHYENTDIDINSFRRAEQSILHDYLFKGKTESKCAICSKSYSIKSLVTAHKKKRSECTENERIDPRIVWPLCKFGCDYIYEERYININKENGIIIENKISDLTVSEKEKISEIIGNKIDDEWLFRSKKYFN